jgi:2-amino-4-hydroxy-6-hydroxymethyldihydropteridine diphosphokinase
MAKALLSLGSNIGDRNANLSDAIARLASHVTVLKRSSTYCTAPVGPVAQDDFYNLAILIDTDLKPDTLMTLCLQTEAAMGRDRKNAVRWGPRLIDIDIILYDQVTIISDLVELPHPRFRERAFVLVPMAEIAPDWTIDGERLDALAEKLDRSGIEKI